MSPAATKAAEIILYSDLSAPTISRLLCWYGFWRFRCQIRGHFDVLMNIIPCAKYYLGTSDVSAMPLRSPRRYLEPNLL